MVSKYSCSLHLFFGMVLRERGRKNNMTLFMETLWIYSFRIFFGLIESLYFVLFYLFL